MKKQQVEKMFENELSIINSRLDNSSNYALEYMCWLDLLNSLYKNKGISKRQYNEWRNQGYAN